MRSNILRVLLILLMGVSLGFAQSKSSASAASSAPSAPNGGIQLPFVLGGILGFGSGTGVGTDRGVGLRNIEPFVGYWYPRVAFFRVGYGFSEFVETDEKDQKHTVDHNDFDAELAVHAYGDLYIVGSYSRSRNLSDLGDVAWNEWGVGFGSVITLISKTMFFAEVQHRWVLDHYDPFLDKNVNGTRLQFNLGFAVYVY